MHTFLVHKIQLFYSSKYIELNLLKKYLTLSYCNQPSLISLRFPLFVIHQPYRLWHTVSDSWQVMISAKVFFFSAKLSQNANQRKKHSACNTDIKPSLSKGHKFCLEVNKLCNLAIIVMDYKGLHLVKPLCELGLIWRTIGILSIQKVKPIQPNE